VKDVVRKLLQSGLRAGQSVTLSRTVMLSNAITLIAILLCSLMLIYLLAKANWDWSSTTKMVLTTIFALFSILVFNKLNRLNTSRLLLSILIPVMSTLIVMLPRISDPSVFHYSPRNHSLLFALLVTCIVPLMVFSTREVGLLLTAMGINLIILLLIDPALFVFSLEYGKTDYTIGRYLGNNIVLLISAFFVIGCTIFLKSLFEFYEKENESLIKTLNERNDELETNNRELLLLNQNIETRNEEIKAQSKELIRSQEFLLTAHHEIERHKAELQAKNHLLEQSLDSKSQDLLSTNQQLIIQNHELHQFSYTVSHNLRGPIASMLGLISIHHFTTDPDEKEKVFMLMEKSAQTLETVIHDLNKIVDIRIDKFNINEKMNLEEEALIVVQSLNVFISENEVKVTLELLEKEIVSIKAYINSILYNLISNAIQYRSPDRKPVIHVSSHRTGNYYVIEVADNGLGIDLDKYRNELFKLYKRFHPHIEGKGLGLYITKQQVEKLNGYIEVESSTGEGSRFRVFLLAADVTNQDR
jgi:signal transduction histidine kinase